MSSDFWSVFVTKFVKSKVKKGYTYDRVEKSLREWVDESSSLMSGAFDVEKALTYMNGDRLKILYDDVVKKYGVNIADDSVVEVDDSEYFLALIQETINSSGESFSSCHAFGPFHKRVAEWKIHLLSLRAAKDMEANFAKKGDGAIFTDKDGTAYMFKDRYRKKAPSVGFVLMEAEKCPKYPVISSEGMYEPVPKFKIGEWHELLMPEVKSFWDVPKLIKFVKGFAPSP